MENLYETSFGNHEMIKILSFNPLSLKMLIAGNYDFYTGRRINEIMITRSVLCSNAAGENAHAMSLESFLLYLSQWELGSIFGRRGGG